MLGANIAAGSARAIRLRTPQNPFSPSPASSSACSPQAFFRPEPDPGYGLSLAQSDCASRRLLPRVNVPGLQLPIRNLRLPGPFGVSAPLPRPVCPDLGRFFASCPSPVPHRSLPALPKTFTPLRGFCPPRDQRSISVRPVSPPAESARSPFAPRSPLCNQTSMAADHRSRSATFPEACCSSSREAKRS